MNLQNFIIFGTYKLELKFVWFWYLVVFISTFIFFGKGNLFYLVMLLNTVEM